MKYLKFIGIVLLLLFVVSLAPAVRASTPTGASPADPLRVTGAWQTLAPNSTLWYYFDYAGDKSRAHLTFDANDASNLTLGIFTPDLAKAWLNDPTTAPIGRGVRPGENTSDANHDLVWLGGFNFAGRYFVAVSNNNALAIAARLWISGDGVALAPAPTPTPGLVLFEPYTKPVPISTLQGQILFEDAGGGTIYTVNGDGSQLKAISHGIDPTWSPDGKQIAFARWDQPAGIFVAKSDGSNERLVFRIEQAVSPRWSPDGAQLVFAHQHGGTLNDSQFCFRGLCFGVPADPHWKLSVVAVSDGTLNEPRCSKHCFSPTWSKDNQTIMYADAEFGILKTNTAGDAESIVYNQNPQVQTVVVSPDGKRIAVQVRNHDHWDVLTLNIDGSNVTPVTTADPLSFRTINNVAPTWSPDSRQVLFLSDRNAKWEFFVANADGSGLAQVLKNVSDGLAIRYGFMNEHIIDWIK